MAMVTPIVVEESITISGGGLRRRVTIPNKHLAYVGGERYVHVSTVPNYAQVLWGSGCRPLNDKDRLLSRTDVFEQVLNARNAKVLAFVGNLREAPMVLASVADLSRPRRSVTRADQLVLPDTITIRTPDIGDVAGIDMEVMVAHKKLFRKCNPLFVMATPANLSYLMAACTWQMEHADIKRCRQVKKVSHIVDQCEMAENVDDDDVNGDDDVESKSTDIDDQQDDVESGCDDSPPVKIDDQQDDVESECDDSPPVKKYRPDDDSPMVQSTPIKSTNIANRVIMSVVAPKRDSKITSFFVMK